MKGKKHFVYMGSSGFPYGLAEIKKMTLISKSLILEGHEVTVLCERGIYTRSQHPDLQVKGIFEGINYRYTSGNQFRNPNFLARNFLKLKGAINQFFILRKMKKNQQLDYAIFSTHNFGSILYYYLLTKIFKIHTILNLVEYYSSQKIEWKHLDKWINDRLYNKYAIKLVDTYFPISEYLIQYLNLTVPDKKYLKIPVLTEFEKYMDVELLDKPDYFFFCGSAIYIEIVIFIIDAFNKINTQSVHLYLTINGDPENQKKIQSYIQQNPKNDRIQLFSNLTEKQLYNYYYNAIGLLIPLRPIIQDEARFPHKIGEYLASGNPVVSTNYGEVKYYFKNEQTMLIAEKYNIDDFAEKMQFIIDNPFKAKEIGINGKNFALAHFDYKTFGKKIMNSLE